jgi:hypothetical protein
MKASEQILSLSNALNQALLRKHDLLKQTDAVEKEIEQIRAVMSGVNLGQQLAGELSAQPATPQE